MRFDDVRKPKPLGDEPKHKWVMGPDGVRVKVKMNPNRLVRRMVHPDGSTYELSLSTGWQINKLHSEENKYGMSKLAEKLRKGHLPYDECPVATGRVPAAKGDKPCPGKFDNDHCCPHIEQIMEARTAAHTRKQDEFAQSMQTSQDRMLKLLENQARAAASAPPEQGPEGHVKLR